MIFLENSEGDCGFCINGIGGRGCSPFSTCREGIKEWLNQERIFDVSVKPILFNTDMVKAILDGRKTVTRRVVKPKYNNTHFKFRTDKYGTEFVEIQNNIEGATFGKNPDGTTWRKMLGYIIKSPPYQPGDVLYVRETYCKNYYHDYGKYFYRADGETIQIPLQYII